jgi:hypothetical protein
MRLLKRLLVAATGVTWDEVARAYEVAHPGVRIEMQFLEAR